MNTNTKRGEINRKAPRKKLNTKYQRSKIEYNQNEKCMIVTIVLFKKEKILEELFPGVIGKRKKTVVTSFSEAIRLLAVSKY